MNFKEVVRLSSGQKTQIIRLWNQEYPKSIAYTSEEQLDTYLAGLEEKQHILLVAQSESLEEEVMGWFIHFDRDGDRWFAMILDGSLQGRGFGSKLLSLAKQRNAVLNGWVIDHNGEEKQDGTYYQSPILFYKKNGFEILEDVPMKKMNISGIKVRWER